MKFSLKNFTSKIFNFNKKKRKRKSNLLARPYFCQPKIQRTKNQYGVALQ
jgi:hypothetical protein